MFVRNSKVFNTNNDGTGGGNNQGNGNQTSNGNQQDNNQGGGNNNQQKADDKNKDPLAQFATVWQPPSKGDGNKGNGGDNGGGNNNSNNNGGGQGNQNNSNGGGDEFKAFLAKQNYFNGVDMPAMEAAFKNGDFPAFQKGMIAMLQNLHGTALKNADNIASGYHDKAVDSAVTKTNAQYNIDQAYNGMFNKHPELKNQAISPVAKTMLKNALAAGKTPEEATAHVYNYFLAVGQTFHKPAGNPNDRQRGDGSGNGSGDGTADINFDDMFKGGQQ